MKKKSTSRASSSASKSNKSIKAPKARRETLEEKTKRIALELIEQLPPELKEPASEVLILVKKRPTADMDEFLMGVFEGPTRDEVGQSGFDLPPRITLFSQNIWDECENDPQAFEEEIRITLYHELGHYLGLDEDELEARELD